MNLLATKGSDNGVDPMATTTTMLDPSGLFLRHAEKIFYHWLRVKVFFPPLFLTVLTPCELSFYPFPQHNLPGYCSMSSSIHNVHCCFFGWRQWVHWQSTWWKKEYSGRALKLQHWIVHLISSISALITRWWICRVNLRNQKRLAASVLNCGKRKIWLDPNEVNEISNANSRKYGYENEELWHEIMTKH